MICKNCKKQISNTAKVCGYCGTKNDLFNEDGNTHGLSAKRIIIPVLSVILSICLGFGAFALVKNFASSGTTKTATSTEAKDETPPKSEKNKKNNPGKADGIEYLNFLGKHKDEVLSSLDSYVHYGDFEGADFYQAEDISFGFAYDTSICKCVAGDFVRIFPDLRKIADNNIVFKTDFDSEMNLKTELITKSESDREVPHLYAQHNSYIYLIGCDKDGNIALDNWCQIIIKDDVGMTTSADTVSKKCMSQTVMTTLISEKCRL